MSEEKLKADLLAVECLETLEDSIPIIEIVRALLDEHNCPNANNCRRSELLIKNYGEEE